MRILRVEETMSSRSFNISQDEHPVKFVLENLSEGLYASLHTWLNDILMNKFQHPKDFTFPVIRLHTHMAFGFCSTARSKSKGPSFPFTEVNQKVVPLPLLALKYERPVDGLPLL